MKNDIEIGSLIAIGTVLFCIIWFAYLVYDGVIKQIQ